MVELVANVLPANINDNGKSDTSNNAYYDVLGISPDASETEIKKDYRKLALKLQPDKDRYSPKNADEAFKIVANAYATLKDSTRWEDYDILQNSSSSGVVPPSSSTNRMRRIICYHSAPSQWEPVSPFRASTMHASPTSPAQRAP